MKSDAAGLLAKLVEQGFEAKLAAGGQCIVVGHAAHIGSSPLLGEGWFQPQDPTSMLPVAHMRLGPGQKVLDLCAGLGTKATQMAEAMGASGEVIATDLDAEKLAALAQAAERMGHTTIETVPLVEAPARVAGLVRLDWILVDAPCSNTGVLSRRPEVRYRLTVGALTKLADRQLALLGQAAQLAGPTTRLMYSTCSIDPEENEQVCTRFLADHADWQLEENSLTLPSPGASGAYWHDGGYWAMLTRR